MRFIQKKQNNSAFTLAEVLITLGIIGVLAALIIPNLIKNYQKAQTVTQLKKAYSTINQAFQNAQMEMGSSKDWDTPTAEWNLDASNLWWDKYFTPYVNLSVVKTCTGVTSSDCWAQNAKYLDGTSMSFYTSLTYLVLKDGTTLRLGLGNNSYLEMHVDLNGKKQPNVLGKDIFNILIYYKAGQVRMAGQGLPRTTLLSDTGNMCNSQKSSHTYKGNYCGALIQQDGWQIKDDYPWN